MTKEGQPSQAAPNSEWDEVESPNFVAFKEIGDFVEGQLIERSKSDRYDFGLYALKQEDGTQIRFHGSAQLDDLMLAINIGDIIRVQYVDTQKQASGVMKLFKVLKKRT